MNGTAASSTGKRKAGFSPDHSPPTKRVVNGKLSPGNNTPDIALMDDYEDESVLSEDVHGRAPIFVDTPGSLGEWQDTIQKVVRNVVAIRFCQTCSFDTDAALTSEATGFVVDSARGHVVGAGPFWGHCVFDNHEEVDCYPVYRDPVHDFGILRYDPEAIKYMLVDGLDLRPDQAK
ncbi:hypothetical protein E4U53_000817, partial [Claviceps sorghi]